MPKLWWGALLVASLDVGASAVARADDGASTVARTDDGAADGSRAGSSDASRADGSSDGAASPAEARAEGLFRQAKKLMEKGEFGAACALLRESEELHAATGTTMNLAYCYENVGRIATAWSHWRASAEAADKQGQPDRAAFARYRASLLEPHLRHVIVSVAPQSVHSRLEVRLDGVECPRDRWGVPLPLDDGEHELSASAPGSQPLWLRFVVGSGHPEQVIVPALETSPAADDRRGIVSMEWVMGGLGLVALGVSAGFAISAAEHLDASNANRNCVHNLCNAAGSAERRFAASNAEAADVSFAVGIGALVTAGALWLITPRGASATQQARGLKIQPMVASDRWSLAVGGTW